MNTLVILKYFMCVKISGGREVQKEGIHVYLRLIHVEV